MSLAKLNKVGAERPRSTWRLRRIHELSGDKGGANRPVQSGAHAWASDRPLGRPERFGNGTAAIGRGYTRFGTHAQESGLRRGTPDFLM